MKKIVMGIFLVGLLVIVPMLASAAKQSYSCNTVCFYSDFQGNTASVLKSGYCPYSTYGACMDAVGDFLCPYNYGDYYFVGTSSGLTTCY